MTTTTEGLAMGARRGDCAACGSFMLAPDAPIACPTCGNPDAAFSGVYAYLRTPTTLTIDPDWTPTSANINALPAPLRRYIHDCITLACDPQGVILENCQLRQQVRAVEAMVEKLRDG